MGRISGGGARSQLWLEIVASVLEMPLEATVVDEGAAYGAALLGGVAAGVWDDAREAVSACVKVTRTIEPRPEWIEPYAEARERFRGLYPALRPLQVGRRTSVLPLQRDSDVGADASAAALLAAFCAILQRMAAIDTGRELLGEERRERILRWLGAEGKVRASDLALRLRVSLDTVRRDLQELSDAGLLRRVHGGALPPSSPGPDSFLERLPDDTAAKAAVAQAAIA